MQTVGAGSRVATWLPDDEAGTPSASYYWITFCCIQLAMRYFLDIIFQLELLNLPWSFHGSGVAEFHLSPAPLHPCGKVLSCLIFDPTTEFNERSQIDQVTVVIWTSTSVPYVVNGRKGNQTFSCLLPHL